MYSCVAEVLLVGVGRVCLVVVGVLTSVAITFMLPPRATVIPENCLGANPSHCQGPRYWLPGQVTVPLAGRGGVGLVAVH